MVLLTVGVIVYYFAVAKRLERWLDRIIERRLERFTDLELVDFEEVLKLNNKTGIAKVDVHEGNPIIGRAIKDLGLSRAGLLVLAIERKAGLLRTPADDLVIEKDDRVVCYGTSSLARDIAHGEFIPSEPVPCAYEQLVSLNKSYGISSVLVESAGGLDGHSLKELHLPSKQILVLAIHRGPDFIPAPNANTLVVAGDRLVCYGPSDAVRTLTESNETSAIADIDNEAPLESNPADEKPTTHSEEMIA